jgi:hypothetical protein
VTASPLPRKESEPREPLTTIGLNCQSVDSSAAASQRRSSAAGTRPVAAARSMRAMVERRVSTELWAGSPASTTKLVGRAWIAAMASPTEAAYSKVNDCSGILVP